MRGKPHYASQRLITRPPSRSGGVALLHHGEAEQLLAERSPGRGMPTHPHPPTRRGDRNASPGDHPRARDRPRQRPNIPPYPLEAPRIALYSRAYFCPRSPGGDHPAEGSRVSPWWAEIDLCAHPPRGDHPAERSSCSPWWQRCHPRGDRPPCNICCWPARDRPRLADLPALRRRRSRRV